MCETEREEKRGAGDAPVEMQCLATSCWMVSLSVETIASAYIKSSACCANLIASTALYKHGKGRNGRSDTGQRIN